MVWHGMASEKTKKRTTVVTSYRSAEPPARTGQARAEQGMTGQGSGAEDAAGLERDQTPDARPDEGCAILVLGVGVVRAGAGAGAWNGIAPAAKDRGWPRLRFNTSRTTTMACSVAQLAEDKRGEL